MMMMDPKKNTTGLVCFMTGVFCALVYDNMYYMNAHNQIVHNHAYPTTLQTVVTNNVMIPESGSSSKMPAEPDPPVVAAAGIMLAPHSKLDVSQGVILDHANGRDVTPISRTSRDSGRQRLPQVQGRQALIRGSRGRRRRRGRGRRRRHRRRPGARRRRPGARRRPPGARGGGGRHPSRRQRRGGTSCLHPSREGEKAKEGRGGLRLMPIKLVCVELE